MSTIEVKVPNIGDFKDVEVIEVLANPGDAIAVEQSLVTVESDKASMEIPSSAAGVLTELKVKLGDRISEGSLLALLEADGAGEPAVGKPASDAAGAPSPASPAPSPAAVSANVNRAEVTPPAGAPASRGAAGASQAGAAPAAAAKPVAPSGSGTAGPIEVKVPNIGEFKDVEVIELLVQPGDQIGIDQSLITVESDKASMEIPSSGAGVLKELKVKIGDRISEGSLLALLEGTAGGAAAAPAGAGSTAPSEAAPAATAAKQPASGGPGEAADLPTPAGPHELREPTTMAAEVSEPTSTAIPPGGTVSVETEEAHAAKPHASPSVRKFARELGVDLSKVRGSGEKHRITHEDVQAWVKGAIARAGERPPASVATPAGEGGAGLGLIPWPKVDFGKLGPIETRPVARIRKIAAANLHRNWVMIPHVTNHDEADITDLEAFRVQLNGELQKGGTKVTMLAFLIKACVSALQKYPEFNSSLEGENLILKRYWHIGFAADTPNGLTVPVIRDADTKGIMQIARETSELAAKARDGKLSPAEMQGGTFTISSLGGIGGTYFTPIINAPEVAILGVCRSFTKPVWDGKKFRPRLTLPLSLSWDHRVVDGAGAARFNVYLAQLLADFRRVML